MIDDARQVTKRNVKPPQKIETERAGLQNGWCTEAYENDATRQNGYVNNIYQVFDIAVVADPRHREQLRGKQK